MSISGITTVDGGKYRVTITSKNVVTIQFWGHEATGWIQIMRFYGATTACLALMGGAYRDLIPLIDEVADRHKAKRAAARQAVAS